MPIGISVTTSTGTTVTTPRGMLAVSNQPIMKQNLMLLDYFKNAIPAKQFPFYFQLKTNLINIVLLLSLLNIFHLHFHHCMILLTFSATTSHMELLEVAR